MYYDDGTDNGYNDQQHDPSWLQVPGAGFGFDATDPQAQQWHYPQGRTQSKQMVRLNPQTGQWEYQDNPEYTPPAPPPGGDKGGDTTTKAGPGLGGDTKLGGLLDPFTEKFVPPPNSDATKLIPPAPQFNPPPDALPRQETPFSYKDFVAPDRFQAPSWDEVLKDPGFDFRRKQGETALTNRAASTGMARAGSTLKDFINYNQDLASQEYGNVYNRKKGAHDDLYNEMFGEWKTGLGAAADTWRMNTGHGLDVTDRLYKAEQDKFNPQMQAWQTMAPITANQSQLDWDRAFQLYGKGFDIYQWNHQFPYNVLSDQQRIGLSGIR